MSAVIEIEQLSKVYRLGELNRGVFFRDWKRKLRGDLSELPEDDPDLFWALRNVSLSVEQGEVVGLLGRNGAGKSTLLKVLAQITAPSRGRVRLRGRVASLLEVGTGFHPEMTGRDNTFLNGTILGMSRREVQAKFDEIVDFAGIEGFIDTPVKHYSNGMRVRLAFAVAAHLEPEILLVDEVLTVGDAGFQKKCIGKIGEVSRGGRTVIMVSHHSAAIESLCTRGLVLQRGSLVFDGTQTEAIEAHANRALLPHDLKDRSDRRGTGEVRVTSIELLDGEGKPMPAPRSGRPLQIAFHFEKHVPENFPRLAVLVTISTHLGIPVFTQASWITATPLGDVPARGTVFCRLPRLPLIPAHYNIGFMITGEMRHSGSILDELENAAELVIEAGDFFGTGRLPLLRDGPALVDAEWRLEPAA